jgi:Flp pilus assembly protein TadG
MKSIKRFAERFANQTSGAIAIIMALALTLLFGVTALAIDYGRQTSSQSHIQQALDAAVLAASNPMVAEGDRKKLFEDTFAASFPNNAKLKSLHYTFSNGKGEGTAVLDQVNYFGGVVGRSQSRIEVKSSAGFAEGMKTEIVFAVDISGSMTGSKIATVRTAAQNVVDQLSASAGGDIKFGLVPFNMAVNIGTANASLVDGTNHPLFSSSGWNGCVLARRGEHHKTSTYDATATDGSGKWHAYIWPPEPNQGGVCVNPSNGTNSGYKTAEPWPLPPDTVQTNGPNNNCPHQPIMRLTSSAIDTKTALSNLEAFSNQGTTIGPAIAWANRILANDGPFGDGAKADGKTRKIVVVLTDGDQVIDGYEGCNNDTNSSEPFEFDPADFKLDGKKLTSGPPISSFTPYGYLVGSDPYDKGVIDRTSADLELDRLSVEACEYAKTVGGVEIYAIAAGPYAGPGTRAYDVLSKCASSGGHLIHTETDTDLAAAFNIIGSKAASLRIMN